MNDLHVDYASAINDLGQVALWSFDEGIFVLDTKTGVKQFLSPFPGSPHGYGFAEAINNKGLVTGYSQDASRRIHSVSWDLSKGGELIDLGVSYNSGYRINDNGIVLNPQMAINGYTGEALPIELGAGYGDPLPTDINNDNLATITNLSYWDGSKAAYLYDYDDHSLITIRDSLSPESQGGMWASALNDVGLVGGAIGTAGWTRPFVYSMQTGAMIDVSLQGYGYGYSYGFYDLNNAGVGLLQVNGTMNDNMPRLTDAIPVVWFDGIGSFNLNDLVDDPDVYFYYAQSINNSGQIIAHGFRRSTGDQVEALLNPVRNTVPEPSSWFLLIAGFTLGGGAIRASRGLSIRFRVRESGPEAWVERGRQWSFDREPNERRLSGIDDSPSNAR